MKLFEGQTIDDMSEEACAVLIMETVPLVMSAYKSEMRRHRPVDMTVPQFRTLIFLRRHTDASLSSVADHLGLTLSTTSKLVDGLVKRALVTRNTSPDDRRRVNLRLTHSGTSTLNAANQDAIAHMVSQLYGLSKDERPVVISAMRALQRVFLKARLPEIG